MLIDTHFLPHHTPCCDTLRLEHNLMSAQEKFIQWHKSVSLVIASQGGDQFFPALYTALRTQIAFDYPQVWLYHRDLPPRLIYNEIPKQALHSQVDNYLDGPYRENPFYQVSLNQPRSSIYRLDRITNRRLKESQFYRQCHVAAGTSDEVAFVARLSGGNVINVCLKRLATRGEFSDEEYQQLYILADLVAELIRYHSEHREFAVPQLIQPGINHQIDLAFKTFGESLLSPREKDVLELMLRGYGTESSAGRLNIAIETVRRHRKSIYRKLDVNSQTDLFSLFINSMSCIGQADGQDPLKVYMALP
jgi:DNA-binding CsgD family transcriptional regulator